MSKMVQCCDDPEHPFGPHMCSNPPMTAPSKTPPCNCSMSDTFNDYYCVKQAWKCCKYQALETALAESRAECERLRTQSDSLNTLNLGQIKIIAKLQSDLREAETSKREAYERAAKVCRDYSNWLKEHHCAADRNAVADYLVNEICALSGERREP